MKALTTAGLTKLIQLIKGNFISNSDTVTTNTVTLATVATSGSYNDLSNKPTIPTDTNDLTNGAGFITGITSGDVTTALGYTPYNSTNPNGYITSSAIANMQTTTNLVTSVSSSSTDSQYPSAKCLYDLLGEVSRNIGEIVQSTIPLTDAGLHLLDGALLQYGSYQAFIDYIAGLYNSGDYDNIFETEANWQTSVTNYGVCGKFVYDSVNNTVRLPKITGFTESTIDTTVLGDLAKAGLPNVLGQHYEVTSKDGEVKYSGAFYKSGTGTNGYRAHNSDSGSYPIINFDASRSSSIYGNSNTVQPQAIKVLYYIVVATSTKTQIQVDIDEIATDLNGKADTDLSNTNDTAKILMSGMGMPSATYENLTLGASNATYTAPANGWVQVTQFFSGSGSVILSAVNQNSDGLSMQSVGDSTNVYIPVNKGQVFKVYYNGTLVSSQYNRFVFIYTKGSESEAS